MKGDKGVILRYHSDGDVLRGTRQPTHNVRNGSTWGISEANGDEEQERPISRPAGHTTMGGSPNSHYEYVQFGNGDRLAAKQNAAERA